MYKRILYLLICFGILLPTLAQSESGYTGLMDAFTRQFQAPEETPAPYNTVPQLTQEDLFEMNDGDCATLFTDGYLTFLRGRYWDQKVNNMEDAIASLNGIAHLLGLDKGCAFYGVYSSRNASGYTIYTYQQRYGNLTLENAVLKVIVDPNGYTAGVVSSFVPLAGFGTIEDEAITPEEAIDVVRDQFPTIPFDFFPDKTRQTSVTLSGVAYHAFAVFTNYPGEAPEGRQYLEHLVSFDGHYLMYLAVSSPDEIVLGDDATTELALAWFADKTADHITTTVTYQDGTEKEITLPLCVGPDGVRYLADPERHILLTDFYDWYYRNQYNVPSDQDGASFSNHDLITYATYIRVYDFYTSRGLHSVDGFGRPLLICLNYCNPDKSPINNACHIGTHAGWAVFCDSPVNHYGECTDVIAHEYTHAITHYAVAGDVYQNESGAINEALSDILGNLCETLLGDTTDTEWLIAEKGGRTLRSMRFPWGYRRPVRVGGSFYIPESDTPSMENDFGGVHTNSLILGHLAYELCAYGLPASSAFDLWLDVIPLLTPYSGLREVHQALLFVFDMHQMDIEWYGILEMLCEQAGI